MPFLNRPVELDLADGTTRRGVLHSVRNNGVYLRPMNGTSLATGDEVLDAKLMGELEKSEDLQEAFFPFFFFPFFFIRRFRFRRDFF
jgi:hypothetical protein